MKKLPLLFLLVAGCANHCGVEMSPVVGFDAASAASALSPGASADVGGRGDAGFPGVQYEWKPTANYAAKPVLGGPRAAPSANKASDVKLGTSPTRVVRRLGPQSGVEVNQGMYAFPYPMTPPPPFFPGSPAALNSNITVTCYDQSSGGTNGCTGSSTHSCTYCMQRVSMYDSPNLEYNDTNDSYVVYCTAPATCGTNSWGTSETPFTNTYVNYGDNPTTAGIRAMHAWWGSFFPSTTNQYQLWVNLEDDSISGGNPCGNLEGLYTGFDHKICLNVGDVNNGFKGSTNLQTQVHEYMHYIHDLDSNLAAKDDSVREGWADTGHLRLALFEWQQGLWSASYGMTLYNDGTTADQHGDQLVNAEHVASEVLSGTLGLTYYPASGCTNMANPYECGTVLQETFWELAWNQCQLSYGACAAGATIIGTGGPYGSSVGWVLADSAYANAVHDATSSTDLPGLFTLIEGYYTNFVNAGYLSSSDYQNVEAVLAHHCLGAQNHCADGSFKNPGSPLPAAHTTKGPLYLEAENATLSGHQATDTASNMASNDKYVALTFSNSTPGKAAFSSISLAAGTYKISVSARQSSSTGTAHWAYAWDSGFFHDAGAVPYNGGAWQWLTAPNALTVSSQSTHSFAIKVSSSGTVNVDVAVLNPQ